MISFVKGFILDANIFIRSLPAIMIMLLGVIFYSILYPQSCNTQVLQDIPLALVDEDRSTSSRTLQRMLEASEGTRLESFSSVLEAQESMKTGETNGVLLIPREFERSLLSGKSIVLPLYTDAVRQLVHRTVLQSVRTATEMMGAGVRILSLEKKGTPSYSALALQSRGRPKIWTLYNPSGNYLVNVVPPVFILILHQTLLMGSAILAGVLYSRAARKEEHGMFFLAGRISFSIFWYIPVLAYYTWVLPRFFDFPSADFSAVLLFLLPMLLACSAAGNIIGRFITNPANIMMFLLPTSMPLLFMAGFVWPPDAMPESIRLISQILPTTPAINGYMYMSVHGASFAEVAPLWHQMWGLFLFYFGIAYACGKHAPEEHVQIQTQIQEQKTVV